MAALSVRPTAAFVFLPAWAGSHGSRGPRSLFPLTDIAVMGFADVIPRLPTLLRRIRQTAEAIWRLHPAAVVSIDAPSFGLRVADRVRATHIPLVPRGAAALGPGPAVHARLGRRCGSSPGICCRSSPHIFGKLGIACTYVGHPVLERMPFSAGVGTCLPAAPRNCGGGAGCAGHAG